MFNETAYNLALGAGCSPDGARVAAAIAAAESSGNPRAYNPETAAGTPQGQGSYGLWQIYRKAHPEFASWDLYDPTANARAMYAVSSGCRNWQPWSTFKNGAYQGFLQAPVDASGGPQQGSNSGGDLSSWLPDFETLTSPIELFSGLPAWAPIVGLVAIAFLLMK